VSSDWRRRLAAPALGRARFQRFFESLHLLSLAGLNFGEGGDVRLSGERLVISAVAERCRAHRSDPVVFDVGANAGAYTAALRETFAPPATIWAFEPARASFQLLEKAFGSADGVQLRNIGFSNRDGAATLFGQGPGSKVGSLYDTGARRLREGLPALMEEPVRLTTIDRFCTDEGIETIDFLKLDVEGHELKVLEGAEQMLTADRIRAIQFEFGVFNLESRTYLRDFFELLNDRYLLHRVLRDALHPVFRYRETHEVFRRATNYVAFARTTRRGSRAV
jgi:FkbM family methyltransferase